jgi:hypothetical protein
MITALKWVRVNHRNKYAKDLIIFGGNGVIAAEIDLFGFLARIDDGAADVPGAGEEFFQRFAVTAPDCALEA